jgi:hypothetical protein
MKLKIKSSLTHLKSIPACTATTATSPIETQARDTALKSQAAAAISSSGTTATELASGQTFTTLSSQACAVTLPPTSGNGISPTILSVKGQTPRPPKFPTESPATTSPSSPDPAQSPDSPCSKLDAFQTMCRLHPDKKFGVSIGIQCCSPDPLFVDLRVPRTSDNFRLQMAPFGQRDEPTFENPVPVAVERGWQSARSLGNMNLKKSEIFVQHAQVVRMPRDSFCLYYALIHFANAVCDANLSVVQLKKELVGYVRQHCDLILHGHPLQTWIKWECQCR